MSAVLLSLRLADQDLAAVRMQTRRTAELVGLDGMQQTRLATAVSEIARNAIEHAKGGTVCFLVAPPREGAHSQRLLVEVRDDGPGIADVRQAMDGRRLATGRLSMGLPGSRRLVDRLAIEAPADGGTLVRLEMDRPPGAAELSAAELLRLATDIQSQRGSPLRELEQQNRELLKVHQELREKQIALEKADERKNHFVKTLVHELRTPLSTLQLTLAVLRRRPDLPSEELVRRCEVMERQTTQLTKLVDELMDAARVAQDKVELERGPHDLNAVVAHALEMSGGALALNAHAVTLKLHPEVLWVDADPSRLTQVVCNLVQNSARYTPAKGHIGIEVARDGAQAVVTVTDDGIGITPDLLPYVFDLFVQGESRPPGLEGGLGIGLSLVRRLVTAHEGQVTAASPGADQGSTFTVRLPLLAQPPLPAAQ